MLHGVIQFNVGFEIKIVSGQKYRIASEVTLNTLSQNITPDLIIIPYQKIDLSGYCPTKYDIPPLTVT